MVGHRSANGKLIVKGNSLAQYAGGANDRIFLRSNVRYRQIVRIPNNILIIPLTHPAMMTR